MRDNKMEVIENFLPDDLFYKIQNIMLSGNFAWHYSPTVGHDTDNDDFYFVHAFYINEQQQSSLFEPIIHPLLGRLNFNFLLRARANLYCRKKEHVQNAFHNDSTEQHMVGLFTINNNNGYTIFEDGTKHHSKANTMLLFPGYMKHASVSQTDEKIRVNINLNLA